MKTYKLIPGIIWCFVLSPIYDAAGQDVHFSQFFVSPLLLNPAAAGNFNGDQRAIINYKDQWQSIANPYRTYALAVDMPAFKEKLTKGSMGVGLTALRDKAGDAEMGTAQLNLSLSYRATLNEHNSLSAGILGGFAQRSINNAALQWGNQDDGVAGFDAGLSSGELNELNNFSYGDFAGGLLWRYVSEQATLSSFDGISVQIGVAVLHLNQPKGGFREGFYEKQYANIVVHGQSSIGLKNTNVTIQPNVLFLKRGPSKEIMVGAMIRYQVKEESKYTQLEKGAAIAIGGHYRVGDAFIPGIAFEYSYFALGVSYDINVSALSVASGGKGGIEISLRYINPNPFKTSGSKYGPSFM